MLTTELVLRELKFPAFDVKLYFILFVCFGWGFTSQSELELSASNTVKVDYRLPVCCSDFNSTTVNSLGLDFIDLLPVTLSISYRWLNVVSNTDLNAIQYVIIITMTGVACFVTK